jgi:hypothetical protein
MSRDKKRNGWTAFRVGLFRAARCRWVLLILFAINLLGAVLLVALPAIGLASGLGFRPAIHQAADGVDPWMVIETMMTPVTSMTLGGQEQARLIDQLRQMTLLGLLTTLAMPIIAWLPAAFLSGGVLLTYAEAEQSPGERSSPPFRWRRFLWGCWHWFGAFLLLGVMQGLASGVLFVPLIGAAAGGIALAGGWMAWIAGPVLACAVALWLALMEYTRIAAVIRGTRNVFRAFGDAVRFIFRNFSAVAGLYGLALLLLMALHALYRWGLMPHLPLERWLLVFIVQQTFITARLWARLVRWAGGVALYQAN